MTAKKFFKDKPRTLENIELYADQVAAKYKPLTNLTMQQLNAIGTERSFQTIHDAVVRGFGTTAEAVKADCRRRDISIEPRQLLMTLAVRWLDYSTLVAGARLANRNHTTVIHAIRQVENTYRTNRDYRNRIAPILRELGINSDEEFYSILSRRRCDKQYLLDKDKGWV